MRPARLPIAVWILLCVAAPAGANSGPVSAQMPRSQPSEQRARQEVRIYADEFVSRLVRDQSYPREALANAWEGTVRVDVTIGRDGRVKRAWLAGSSGHPVLDEEALQKVRFLTELPDPPRFLRGREFTLGVPVVFRLEQ